jgi:hypothetical protein
VEVFVARAEARARLVCEGDLDMHEAVDVLQAAALQTGVVDALGQDRVQATMAKAFASVRVDADVVPQLGRVGYLADDETSERGAVARSTIDAAEYLVRQGDADRLREWLTGRGAVERAAIRKHLEATRCARSARSR